MARPASYCIGTWSKASHHLYNHRSPRPDGFRCTNLLHKVYRLGHPPNDRIRIRYQSPSGNCRIRGRHIPRLCSTAILRSKCLHSKFHQICSSSHHCLLLCRYSISGSNYHNKYRHSKFHQYHISSGQFPHNNTSSEKGHSRSDRRNRFLRHHSKRRVIAGQTAATGFSGTTANTIAAGVTATTAAAAGLAAAAIPFAAGGCTPITGWARRRITRPGDYLLCSI